jgi:hypothetical protein
MRLFGSFLILLIPEGGCLFVGVFGDVLAVRPLRGIYQGLEFWRKLRIIHVEHTRTFEVGYEFGGGPRLATQPEPAIEQTLRDHLGTILTEIEQILGGEPATVPDLSTPPFSGERVHMRKIRILVTLLICVSTSFGGWPTLWLRL